MKKNFLDPQTTKDGEPWGTAQYKHTIKEAYYICRGCNTSYNEVLELSVPEKVELLHLIADENQKYNKMWEERKKKNERKNFNT